MKFTYINQVDQRDCGAASLAMILVTFGHDVSIAEIRDRAKISLDGATALGIKKAAESLGLETKAIQADMSLFTDYNQLPYPFIVHVLKPDQGILLNHYYVVYKATNSHVYIADPDPTVKKRKMSYQEFNEHWTGVALFFAPTPNFQPTKNKKTTLTSFLPLVFKQKGLILNVVTAALLVTAISILGSYFVQLLIDEYIPNGLLPTLSLVSIGLLTAYIFQQIMSYTQKYLLLILGQRLSIDLILSYVKHLYKLPMKFFYTRRVGEITSRFNDANAIIDAVASAALTLLLDVGIVFIMSIVLLSYNAEMFGLTIMSIPLYVLIVGIFARAFHRRNTDEMKAGAHLEASIIEGLNGMETIKALGAEENSYSKIDTAYVKFLKRSFKNNQLQILQESLKEILRLSFQVFVLWYGAHLVMENRLSIGQLMAYNALLAYFTQPLQSIIDLQSKLQTAIVAAQRLNEVYEVKSEFEETSASYFINPEHDIDLLTVENISFEYQYNRTILNNLSLNIHKNEKIALVGGSGSGKSTLAKLLVRFYDLDSELGSIKFKHTNIQQIHKQNLRNQITYVPQEPHIFTGTVIDNLLLGAPPETTMEDILKATEIAHIRNDIEHLEQGFNTEISESGGLSGGQRQRLSLARGLLTGASTLILDESTSNLDLLSEKIVVDNLLSMTDRTIIFIAHRLTIAERVPRTVMLANGQVVADGAHDDLLQTNLIYRQLVQK